MKRLAILLLALPIGAADQVPPWVSEAGSQRVAAYPSKVTAVELLREEELTVDATGRRTMRERSAIRSLQKSKQQISAYRAYDSRSGRISAFRAWVVNPDGRIDQLPKSSILDLSISGSNFYDETRAKAVDPGALVPGSTFAYEVIEEEKTIFDQYQHAFQEWFPVLVSRFILNLPAGAEVRGSMVNHANLDPAVSGHTYTWELRDLPPVELEEYGPGIRSLIPRLGITYLLSQRVEGMPRSTSWPEVSAWLTSLGASSSDITPAISQKAAELTNGATDQLDRIRRIAKFVQQTTYVSIQLNLTKGGGYTPRPAEQVLKSNYGDCKDKATLMRVLLKAVGIESYLVSIYSGDRRYVQEKWPSAQQFNHAIIAVRVADDVELPALLKHPALGRLLIFDPTDPHTPVGELPGSDQGSLALILAGAQGDLVRAPVLPPSFNRIESHYSATFEPNGLLKAQVVRNYFGQAASRLRSWSTGPDGTELKRSFESILAGRFGGVTLDSVIANPAPGGAMRVELAFTAARFGQMLQNRLLLLTPGTLALGSEYLFPAKPRLTPVRLTPSIRRDAVQIRVPQGFVADEVPPPAEVISKFGKYNGSWSVNDGIVNFDQSVEVNDIEVAPSEYESLRAYFEELNGRRNNAVVLVRR